LLRRLAAPAPLRRAASEDSETAAELATGDDFWLLDHTSGWAWGYGGDEKRVGYVRSEILAA
jgi:hypothetical protein